MKTPQVKWHPLMDYPLSKIEKDFQIAEFERKPSSLQVTKLINNILKNEFYNICLHVVEQDNKWVVIDGQHRLMAFQQLRDKFGLKKFDFMLAVHDKAYGRKTYRLLNIGKKLTAKDHSKALDNGKIPFFNELRPYLDHYKKWDKMSYSDMLFAHNYATKAKETGSINVLDDVLKSLTNPDITQMVVFCKSVAQQCPSIGDEAIYRSSIYRPLYKYVRQKSLTEQQIKSLITWLKQQPKLEEMSHGRRMAHFVAVEKLLASYR